MLALDDLDVVVAADTQTSNGAVHQRVTLLVGLASAISSVTEATDPVLCDEAAECPSVSRPPLLLDPPG